MSSEAGRLAWGHIASLELRSPAPVQGPSQHQLLFQYLQQLPRGASFSVQGRKRQLQCRESAGRPAHWRHVAHEVRGAPGGTALHLMENMLMGLPGIASLFLGGINCLTLEKIIFAQNRILSLN